MEKLVIKGARTNTLKNIDIEIPKNKLIVVTGPSGSGKSSFAFDTIYAEGSRRYVASLSSYGKQLLGQMKNSEFESITGLAPAIAVTPKIAVFNPRSTVGTMTEINDHLRILWSRLGSVYCPNHGTEIIKKDPDSLVEEILKKNDDGELLICVELIGDKREKKSSLEKLNYLKKEGFSRIWINDQLKRVEEVGETDLNCEFLICVDRIILGKTEKVTNRLFESIELALKYGKGVFTTIVNRKNEEIHTEKAECPLCSFSIEKKEPVMFSFNTPEGACPKCDGIGVTEEVDLKLVIPNTILSLEEGAIFPLFEENSDYYQSMLKQFAVAEKIDLKIPYNKLKKADQEKILYGTAKKFTFKFKSFFSNVNVKEIVYPGIIEQIKIRSKSGMSEATKKRMGLYINIFPCNECHGKKLNKKALSVKVNGLTIADFLELQVDQAIQFLSDLNVPTKLISIFLPLKKLLLDKLQFLFDIGLYYLNLSRNSSTLSGGEIQRIQLAAKISSKLTNVIYVLDEPSTGLHQKDKVQLINSLKRIVGLGNTVIVVEHDFEIIRAADFVVEFGKSGGKEGGFVVYKGTVQKMIENSESTTGQYLSNRLKIEVPTKRRIEKSKELVFTNINELSLRNLDVKIPLEKFVAVTGVSGSGKSTLVNKVIGETVSKKLYKGRRQLSEFGKVTGIEHIKDLVMINQMPIGKNNRSNLVTYCGLFDDIRKLFAKTNAAKVRGYDARRFSFNIKGGRCETCEGEGTRRVEMSLLPDIYVKCDVCHGKQFNSETLEVTYNGKNISDVLGMTVLEALKFFEFHSSFKRKLSVFEKVGLGYIQLGQAGTTLSGGEAQRIKLATELAKIKKKGALYILDEPTNGLNISDIQKLIDVLQEIVDKGNTVLMIEHNLEIIKTVDHIIDMGPMGGSKGGQIMFEGAPEKIVKNSSNSTGLFLSKFIDTDIIY